MNTAPETAAGIDYSKIGSLKDIISTLDYTSFSAGDQAGLCAWDDCGRVQWRLQGKKAQSLSMFFNENDGDGWYKYRQVTVEGNTFLDTEEGDWDSLSIGQYPGVYINKGETGNLWWFDYTYAYQLQGNLSEEEMIAVAESLLAEK